MNNKLIIRLTPIFTIIKFLSGKILLEPKTIEDTTIKTTRKMEENRKIGRNERPRLIKDCTKKRAITVAKIFVEKTDMWYFLIPFSIGDPWAKDILIF